MNTQTKTFTLGLICMFPLSFIGCQTMSTQERLKKEGITAGVLNHPDSRSGSYGQNLKNIDEINTIHKGIKKDLEKKKELTAESAAKVMTLAELLLVKGQYQQAQDKFKQVLRLDTDNKRARLLYAFCAIRLDQIPLAILLLNQQGGDSSNDSDVLNAMAIIADKQGMPNRSRFLLEQSLDKNPDHIASRINLGTLLLKHGFYGESQVHFQRVLKLDPENTDAKIHYAMALLETRNLDGAQNQIEQVLDHDSKSTLANTTLLAIDVAKLEAMNDQDEVKDLVEELTNKLNKIKSNKNLQTSDKQVLLSLIVRIKKSGQTNDIKSNDQLIELAAKLKKPSPKTTIAAQSVKTEKQKPQEFKIVEKKPVAQPEPKADDVDSLEDQILN